MTPTGDCRLTIVDLDRDAQWLVQYHLGPIGPMDIAVNKKAIVEADTIELALFRFRAAASWPRPLGMRIEITAIELVAVEDAPAWAVVPTLREQDTIRTVLTRDERE